VKAATSARNLGDLYDYMIRTLLLRNQDDPVGIANVAP